MVKYFLTFKEGENLERLIINDLKPDYNCGEWIFNYDDYINSDCIQTSKNTYNGGRFHKESYYTDFLKYNRNYNLAILKIYKNGTYKIYNLGNKYRYSKAPIN